MSHPVNPVVRATIAMTHKQHFDTVFILVKKIETSLNEKNYPLFQKDNG